MDLPEDIPDKRIAAVKVKEPWKSIGVYRTFPLPIFPLPPYTSRIKWSRPGTVKKDKV